MKHAISLSEAQNTEDPVFRLRMMYDVISQTKQPGTLHMPLLNLVSAFIDGLARGKPNETKKAYIVYLKKHFPELCNELGAEVFYSKYRNAAIHEFSIKPGFAIGRDSGLKGRYVGTQEVKETGQTITILNIDKLVDDFLHHVKTLLSKHTGRE